MTWQRFRGSSSLSWAWNRRNLKRVFRFGAWELTCRAVAGAEVSILMTNTLDASESRPGTRMIPTFCSLPPTSPDSFVIDFDILAAY